MCNGGTDRRRITSFIIKNKMSKEMKELSAMSDDKLISHKKELLINVLATSPGLVNPKFSPSTRGQIRRRIARINTLMGERKRRGVLKEEKRLK